MRFACDRCKTRYSIADERVRGKILKIRCKSCANVITVKEGMDAPPETGAAPAAADRSAATASGLPERPEWSPSNGATGATGDSAVSAIPSVVAPAPSGRAYRPTTMAPQSTVGSGGAAPIVPAPKPAAALGAAFASAMAGSQAPAQLEDEWYVSRDGDQHGPFSLPDAQAWVSQHPYDAELYCWCEGFDDWLPVDRIAHFRGLRPRPVPPAAPPSGPLPRPAPLAASASGAPAATSAASSAASSAAPAAPAATSKAPLSGPLPLLGRSPTRPTGANPVAPATSNGAPDDKPQFAATMAALGGAAAPPQSNGLGRAAFDAGDLGDLGAPGFTSEGPRRSAIGSSNPVPPAASATPAPSASGSLPGTDPDDLEFGEVSRVVRIADIGKTMRPQPRAASSAGLPGASSSPKSSPLSPSSLPPTNLSPAALGPLASSGTGSHGVVGAALGGAESVRLPLPVLPATQHRNHALLLGAVAVGLIGAGVAAFFLLSSSEPEDPAMISLSAVDVSDLTIRPDEPRRGSGEPEPAGSAATAPTRPTNPANPGIKRPTPGTAANPTPTPTSGGKVETAPTPSAVPPLGADEVEEMSQKNSSGLQRCYEAALKKDIFLEVKSIKVTLSIDATGVVTNVAMSSHADHPLGQCMISRIRNWRFRPNSRGLDAKFTVAFGRT